MIKNKLTNKAKSQICLGLALFLIVLNCISSFILIAPYEAIKDNTLPFIGAFLGSYVHYRKKEKNNNFQTKKDKILPLTTFFYFSSDLFSVGGIRNERCEVPLRSYPTQSKSPSTNPLDM